MPRPTRTPTPTTRPGNNGGQLRTGGREPSGYVTIPLRISGRPAAVEALQGRLQKLLPGGTTERTRLLFEIVNNAVLTLERMQAHSKATIRDLLPRGQGVAQEFASRIVAGEEQVEALSTAYAGGYTIVTLVLRNPEPAGAASAAGV